MEDKIVQEMTRRVLDAIYEPVFLDTSYGFRPGRSCHDALRQLNHAVMREPVNWLLDIDLAQFFDSMPHTEILAVLSKRIADQKFLRLIARMLKAGVQTPGGVVQDELGSPQGSIVSPVIANAFLDHVLDQWFVTAVRQHCRGYCALVRYADDALAVFEREDDARRFWRVLPLRLGKFGLRLNVQKTHLLAFGKRQAWQAFRDGTRLPTVDYLGFTHYWGRSRTGKARLRDARTSKAAASCPGGPEQVASSGTERPQTPRPVAGDQSQDARALQLLWGDRQQPEHSTTSSRRCGGWCSSGSIAEANDAVSAGRVFVATPSDILCPGLAAWSNSCRYGECPCEEARAVVPQAGFCEGEAQDSAGSIM